MAVAGKWLSGHFNRPGHNIIDYRVYSICSDGDLMEGISSEAASIAGHLELGNLVWIYDSNNITIEGGTDLAYSEDTAMRFGSCNWHVERVSDSNDLKEIEKALSRAEAETRKPSLVILKSQIAYGSPNKQNTCEAHGAPLGKEEIRLTKEFYGWNADDDFHVPNEISAYGEAAAKKGSEAEARWKEGFEKYSKEYPELAKEFEMLEKRALPEGWDKNIPVFPATEPIATRSANSDIINAIGKQIPWFMGGAADVGSSTKTYLKCATSFSATDREGRNFHFGIREHSMASIASGMCLSGLRPYASTYFVFADYMKPSIRLASLMQLPVTYIFTHDSIGVGEDGPTHQPIEHLAALRATPNIDVIRPCDANELAVLWKHAMELRDRPAAFVLTRQKVPVIDRERFASAEGAQRGGYVIADSSKAPDIIIISTGSEVHICIEAYEKLKERGINPRVVRPALLEPFRKTVGKVSKRSSPSVFKRKDKRRGRSDFRMGEVYGSGECR